MLLRKQWHVACRIRRSEVGNKRWRLLLVVLVSKLGEISDEISDRRISTRVYVTTQHRVVTTYIVASRSAT